MNHLQNAPKLNNTYYILRHGQSKANTKNLIISDPKTGTKSYGLTEKGKKQVKESIQKNKQLNKNTIIYTSDFKRARQTAQIAKQMLKAQKIHMTRLLRERHFGNYENTHNKNYNKVWQHDKKDPNHTNENVESTNNVLKRTTRLIKRLEKTYKNKNILLVAHGDSLQILQTGFLKQDPSSHRNIKHLDVAEVRKIEIN